MRITTKLFKFGQNNTPEKIFLAENFRGICLTLQIKHSTKMEKKSDPTKLRVAKTVVPDNRPDFNELVKLHNEMLRALYFQLNKPMPGDPFQSV